MLLLEIFWDSQLINLLSVSDENRVIHPSKCLEDNHEEEERFLHLDRSPMNFGSITHIQCTYVTAVFRNYFNFPLVVLLRAARKSRGDITARGDVVYLYTCVRVCVYTCTYTHMHMQLARCITSFGHTRRLLDISRFLFFPFRFPLSVLPSSARCSSDAQCPCTCALHMHTCLCLSEHCARLVAVPCRCMQILSSNLVSARASVLRGRGNGEGWKVAEGGRRGGERGSRGRR